VLQRRGRPENKKNLIESSLRVNRQERFSNSTMAIGRRGHEGMAWCNNFIEVRRMG